MRKAYIWVNLAWAFFWVSCIFLTTFHFETVQGARNPFPNGQYFFAVISLLLAIFIYVVARKEKTNLYLQRSFIIWALLAMLLGFSIVNGIALGSGLRFLAILTGTSLFCVFFGAWLVSSRKDLLFPPILLFSSFIAVLATLLEIVGPMQWADLVFRNFYWQRSLRWAFWFEEANGLGWTMVLGVSAVLAIMLRWSTKVSRLSLFFTATFLVYVLLMSNSRASLGWLVANLVLFLIYFSMVKKRNFCARPDKLPAYCFLGVTLVLGLALYFGDDLTQGLRLESGTNGRMKIWLIYWEVFKQYPFFGLGFGTTSYSNLLVNQDIKSPLNVYIGMLGETGLLGLLPFLIVFWGGIARCGAYLWNNIDNIDELYHTAFGVFIVLVGLAVQQNGEWQILRVHPLHYLWVVCVTVAWLLPFGTSKHTNNSSGIARD